MGYERVVSVFVLAAGVGELVFAQAPTGLQRSPPASQTRVQDRSRCLGRSGRPEQSLFYRYGLAAENRMESYPDVEISVDDPSIFDANTDFPSATLRAQIVQNIAREMRAQSSQGFQFEPQFAGNMFGVSRVGFRPAARSMGVIANADVSPEARQGYLDVRRCPANYEESEPEPSRPEMEEYAPLQGHNDLPAASCHGRRIMFSGAESGLWLHPVAESIVFDFCRQGNRVVVHRYLLGGLFLGESSGRGSQISNAQIPLARRSLVDNLTRALRDPHLFEPQLTRHTDLPQLTGALPTPTDNEDRLIERGQLVQEITETARVPQRNESGAVQSRQGVSLPQRQQEEDVIVVRARAPADRCQAFSGPLNEAGIPLSNANHLLNVAPSDRRWNIDIGSGNRVQRSQLFPNARQRQQIMTAVAAAMDFATGGISTQVEHVLSVLGSDGLAHVDLDLIGAYEWVGPQRAHVEAELRRCGVNYTRPSSCRGGQRFVIDFRRSDNIFTGFLEGLVIDYCPNTDGTYSPHTYYIQGSQRSYLPYANANEVTRYVTDSVLPIAARFIRTLSELNRPADAPAVVAPPPGAPSSEVQNASGAGAH